MSHDTFKDLPCEECGWPLSDHDSKNICPARCHHCGEWSFDCRCGGSATQPRRRAEPMTQAEFDGIKNRHAYVECTASRDERLKRSIKMAYLSHLDRGDLIAEVERQNESMKDIASRANSCVSKPVE